MQTNPISGPIPTMGDPLATPIPPKLQGSQGKSFAYHVEIDRKGDAESVEFLGDPDSDAAAEDVTNLVADEAPKPTGNDKTGPVSLDLGTVPADSDDLIREGTDSPMFLGYPPETGRGESRVNSGQPRGLPEVPEGDLGVAIVKGQPQGRPELPPQDNSGVIRPSVIPVGYQTSPQESELIDNRSEGIPLEKPAQTAPQETALLLSRTGSVPQNPLLGIPAGAREQLANNGGDSYLPKVSVGQIPSQARPELANFTLSRTSEVVSGDNLPADQSTSRALAFEKGPVSGKELPPKLTAERIEINVPVSSPKGDLSETESRQPLKPGMISEPDGLVAASLKGSLPHRAQDPVLTVPVQYPKATPEVSARTPVPSEVSKDGFAIFSQSSYGAAVESKYLTAVSDPKSAPNPWTATGVPVAVPTGIPVQTGAMNNGAVLPTTMFALQDNSLEDGKPGEASVPSLELTSPPGSARPTDRAVFPPGTARAVVAQLTEALINTQGSKVDIALSPEELGRVRMVLSPSESGISVSITTERPETLELMRRHIDQLTEEFRNLGYVDIAFEFSGEGSDSNFDDGSNDRQTSTDSQPDGRMSKDQNTPDTNPNTGPPVSRGLDMRL